jgi:hypothetical protein
VIYIVGGVFSQAEGFTQLSSLWGPMAFHAVTMALGTFCIGKATAVKQAAV